MKKLLLLLSLLLPSLSLAQYARYDGIAFAPSGKPVPFASVAVCTQPATTSTQPCSPLANLFSSTSGGTIPNPLPSTTIGGAGVDTNGNFHFYALPGVYTIQIYGNGVAGPFIQTDIAVQSPFIGGQNNIVAYAINGTQYIEGNKYPCTDVGITSAEAVLYATSTGRGVVDASGCIGSPALTIATTVNIGQTSSAKPILFKPPPGTTLCTVTSGPCFAVTTSSSIACPGAHGASYCFIHLSAGAVVTSIVKTIPDSITNVATHIVLEGIDVENDLGGSISGAAVELSGCEDCQTYNLTVSNPGGRSLWVHDGAANDPSNSVHLYGTLVNGNHNAGSRPVVVEANTNGGGTNGTQFFGFDFGHPGAGNFIIELNGHNAGGLASTQFYGGYMESNSTDTSTDLIKITDANSTELDSLFLNRLSGSSTASGLNITESSSGKTYGTVVANFSLVGGNGTCTNVIKDSIPGEGGNLSSCNVPNFAPLTNENANQASRIGPFSVVSSSVKITDQGTCTMASGACTAQSLSRTYTAAPLCFVTWNGSGTLTGILKSPSTTTTVTPASSVGTDTAVVNWECLGN